MIFPVKAPYTVTADIIKYSGTVFSSAPHPAYLEQKKSELSKWKDDVCAQLHEAQPYISSLATYCGLPPASSIQTIALQVEEDLAIMLNGKLAAICFCFPSGFVPAAKLGRSFFDLHAPVGDGERLRASNEKIMEVICKPNALYRRYVWTLTALNSLSQLPYYKRPVPTALTDLYFRTETQTTVGIDGNACYFFVKVEHQPLSAIWEDREKRNLLLESLDSMSDAVLEYKHLKQIRTFLKAV